MPPPGQRSAEQEEFLQWARTFGGAPVVIVALTEAHGDPQTRKMNLESVCAAFSYLLLAATAEGLGTCWMTGLLRSETLVHKLLGIPGN
ncbi:MAG: hypothetical protein PWP65_1572 [Clostridia bacterium]|nr:hypothetical protein [Clostridia bacterium]